MPTTEDARLEAREILSRVASMVKTHRLVRGSYIIDAEHPEHPPGAPMCNGYEACAIGALYLSAGVRPRRNAYGDVQLPGIDATDAYVARYGSPALKLAYAALNRQAERELLKHDDDLGYEREDFNSAVERLFEGTDINTDDMLALVNRARTSLRPA